MDTNSTPLSYRLPKVKAILKATGQELPIYVADYVIGEYGCGAVMGVPSHDDRDGRLGRAQGLEGL